MVGNIRKKKKIYFFLVTYSLAGGKKLSATCNSINESYKDDVEQEELDTKEYMYDSNHKKLRTNLWR